MSCSWLQNKIQFVFSLLPIIHDNIHIEKEHISSSESLSLTSKQTVICGLCSKVFENVKECQNHVGNHHENGK